MLLAVLIVQERLFGRAFLHRLPRDGDFAVLVHIAVEHRHFERGERAARVAVGKVRDHGDRLVRDLHLLIAEAAFVGERVAEKADNVLRFERLQHEHLAARKKRPVHLEGGVLCRRADQNDAPPLHIGQKGVLLRLVEAVDLVHKEDGLFPEAAGGLRLLHHLLDLFNAARDGGKIDEPRLGLVRDDAGERRLAHAGRAPEDHRPDGIALDNAAQHLFFAEKVFLPAEFGKIARTKPRRKRLRRLLFKQRRLIAHNTPPLFR